MRSAALLFPMLLACSPGGDGSGSDIPVPSGSADDCGTSAPTINEVTIADGGMQNYDSGSFPALLIRADTSDEDGDLHYYEMRVWWDDEVDGTVDTTEEYLEVYGIVSQTPCEVPRTTFSMQLAVTGTPPFDTDVEFGVVVYDDQENPTNGGEPTIVEFHTPDAEGNYPG